MIPDLDPEELEGIAALKLNPWKPQGHGSECCGRNSRAYEVKPAILVTTLSSPAPLPL